MKKITLSLLSILMVGLAACRGNNTPTTPTTPVTPTPSVTPSVSPSIPQTGIKLNATSIKLRVGDTYTLKVTSNNVAEFVMWSTDSSNISLSSTSGLSTIVTALSVGKANVTVIDLDSGETAKCAVTIVDPSQPITPTPSGTPEPTVVPSGMVVVNFYLDFTRLDAKEVYYSVTVENGSTVSEPNKPTTPVFPEFPVFLGWSRKEIIDDKKELWDFANDKVSVKSGVSTFNIFGIWVAEGEK